MEFKRQGFPFWKGFSLLSFYSQLLVSLPAQIKEVSIAVQPFYVGKIKLIPSEIIGDWGTFTNEVDYLIINIPPKRIDNIENVFPQQIQQLKLQEGF